MKLTKYGHACWRLEKDGKVLVIDPGAFSGQGLLDGADAVLITHEHWDHLDADLVRNAPDLEVWTCEAVADQLADSAGKVQTVRHGDAFTAAGFSVRAFGEWHARNHPDIPVVQNVGFLVDDELFYPGDALTVPEARVGTLLVPTGAPWLKLGDMVGYLREVRPARAYSTHDGLYNDIGYALVDSWLQGEAEHLKADVRRVPVGDSVTLS
ncbi:MBL fold metallo-hydrolase [Nonomuraea sediminis]|uniref:MBL fold metallo-hydrolase n=1 Tax=Nonomuraea sediminis TaxID=2835864 RepID=UPI001BDC317F|nr:MBL fold metallo-hydrolase [Nonomuraea sediminis]